MSKLLTCFMFILLVGIVFLKITTHYCFSPVGLGLFVTTIVSLIVIYKHGFNRNFTNRFPY